MSLTSKWADYIKYILTQELYFLGTASLFTSIVVTSVNVCDNLNIEGRTVSKKGL